jgi:hypothetical protein
MDDPAHIVDGEPRACQEMLTSIQYWSLAVSCTAATTWLARFVPNHGSVAVAPAFMAMATFLLAMDAGELSDWLCLLTAATTFLTLLGCGLSMGPLVRRCGGKDTDIHEALVWLLYTSLAATAMIGDADMLEVRFGFGLGASIVAGTLLGHPALYLVGWFGGIGLVVVGLFLSVVYQEEWNYEWHYIVLIAVGVFGGAGCIAVGRLLITYRAYLRYYSMRAWHAVKSAGAPAANRGTQMPADTNSQEGSFLTDGLLRNSNE